ncbi:MAG: hypothetical protein CMH64_01465 [Nanoarchaeota archaeon]|nr:hypothetical protein [Nanoarchaeota archaeon]|tara:strand:+ start:1065 stop:1346 length:282 start_codon:yes stop_codon:yes gene_type:complete
MFAGSLYNFYKHGFYVFRIIKKNKDIDLENFIKRIKIKTLLIWGETDEYFSMLQARKFNKLIRNSELKIIKGNHDWCLLYPEKIREILENENN